MSVFVPGGETRGPSEAHLTLWSPFSIAGLCKVLYGVMNFYLISRGSSPANGGNAGQWMCVAHLMMLADKLWWSGDCCEIFWWNLVQWTLNWQLLVREMELEIIRSVLSTILWCWVLSDAPAPVLRLSHKDRHRLIHSPAATYTHVYMYTWTKTKTENLKWAYTNAQRLDKKM